MGRKRKTGRYSRAVLVRQASTEEIVNSKARRAGRRPAWVVAEERAIAKKEFDRRAKSETAEQLERMNTPKRGRSTFIAEFATICPRCGLGIKIGDTCHFTSAGLAVHDKHTHKDEAYTICPLCFLAKPCGCQ